MLIAALHYPIWIALITGAVAILVIRILFCRQICLFLDSFLPGRRSPLPHEPMLIEVDPAGISSRFMLGPENRSLSWPDTPHPFELDIAPDGRGRLVLRAGPRSFTFGPIRKCWDDPVKPQYEFVPEAGDEIWFTREVSRASWPTPFTFNVLGGATPSWKRFTYDRLRWRKTSGAVLEIVWRSELWLYPRSGWADNYQRRLTRVRIQCSPIETAAAAHLAKTRGWTAAEYRLETLSGASNETAIAVVHLADQAATHPGDGKSLILRFDQVSGKLLGESGFQ
jgi:hypothetical protein